MSIQVNIIRDGESSSRTLEAGTQVREILGPGETAVVNGRAVGGDYYLNDGDEVRIVASSAKAGAEGQCAPQSLSLFRHGDVCLYRIPEPLAATLKERLKNPRGSWSVEPVKENLVLAEGESTGHKHLLIPDAEATEYRPTTPWDRWTLTQKVTDRQVEDLIRSGERLLALEGKARLTHEEHGEMELPEGLYVQVPQREYDEAAVRAVRD